MDESPLLPAIVFCGIDGTGKTTIIERLRQDNSFLAAHFIKKANKENVDRVLAMNRPIGPMPAAYLSGPLARAIRWAHALDYLRYYDQVVQPLKKTDSLIVSDRWVFCAIAFANTGTDLGSEIAHLLRVVPRPLLTILLDASEDVAVGRLERERPLWEEEHIEILRSYRAAYQRFFTTYDGPFVCVQSSTLDDTYQEVRSAIRKRLSI